MWRRLWPRLRFAAPILNFYFWALLFVLTTFTNTQNSNLYFAAAAAAAVAASGDDDACPSGLDRLVHNCLRSVSYCYCPLAYRCDPSLLRNRTEWSQKTISYLMVAACLLEILAQALFFLFSFSVLFDQ